LLPYSIELERSGGGTHGILTIGFDERQLINAFISVRPRPTISVLTVESIYTCYPRAPMLKDFLARIWRGAPAGLRRMVIRFTNTRFTVTAGAVIFNEQNQVLILKHPFRAGSGWGLPGGFLKAGEQPLQALQRELREEIGIELAQAEVFWTRTFKRPKQVEILFLGKVKGHVELRSMEVVSAVWCDPDTLPEGMPKDQKLLVRRAVEKPAG